MNKMSKKIVTGTMAASMLLGGIIFAQSQVSAATASTTTTNTTHTAADKPSFKHDGQGGKRQDQGGRHINLIEDTAAILGIDQTAIQSQLEQNKTFTQIAEANKVSKADFLAKLVAVETKAINAAVTAGTLTQVQADQQLSGLTDRLTQAIDRTQPFGGEHGGRGGHDGGFGPFGKLEDTAKLLGMTEDELQTALNSGKTLAEVAATKGISEDQLITKIKDGLTDTLKQYVNEKRPAAPAKTEASSTKAAAAS